MTRRPEPSNLRPQVEMLSGGLGSRLVADDLHPISKGEKVPVTAAEIAALAKLPLSTLEPHVLLSDIVHILENALTSPRQMLVATFAVPPEAAPEGERSLYLRRRAQNLMTSLLVSERYANLPILAVLPTNSREMLAIVRAGIPFALAQRPGYTLVVDEFSSDSEPSLASHVSERLGEWAGRWRPNDWTFRRRVMDQQFDPTEAEASLEPVQDRLITFTNPHVISRSRINQELVSNLVGPWLQRLVADTSKIELADSYAESVPLSEVATHMRLLDELLFNLSDYAFDKFEDAISYVQLFAASSIDDVGDRVHITVLDNGAGLLTTLNEKIDESLRGCSDAELFASLLQGAVRHHRGRGKGLADVVATLGPLHGSAMFVCSARDGNGTVIAEVWKGNVDVHVLPWLNWQGTLAVIAIDLPTRTGTSNHDQHTGAKPTTVQSEDPAARPPKNFENSLLV